MATITVRGKRFGPVYASCREQAELKLEQLKLRARCPQNIAGPDTVDSCVARHLARKEIDPETIADLKDGYKKHGSSHIGHRPLHQVTPLEIADWTAAMLGAGVGARTRQQTFDTVRSAMKEAVDLGMLQVDPTRGVKRPSYERKDIAVFSPSEVKSILLAAEGHRNAAVYWLVFGCGMRQGEVFGLQWDDVDLQAGTALIRRQVVEKRGKQIIRPKPKTKSGFRVVRLPPTVLAVLKERQKIALAEGLAACEWVCPTERGKPWRRSNFAVREWKPLLDGLGLERRGLHHGRHSSATIMLRSKIAPHIVSAVIGHKKTSTTLDIYAHALPGDDSGALSVVADQIAVSTPFVQGLPAGPSPGEEKSKSG